MSNPEVEVHSFKQQGGESLKDAWYRINNALASLPKLSFGTSAFFFGHNPTNSRDRTRPTNSKVSSIDIQFASSRLTVVIRGSSSGCRDDEDTPVNPAQ
jgi:hypothetical protein